MPDWSIVNDVHSGLNATRVDRIFRPESIDEVRNMVRSAGARPLAIAGGRHAMGGQQFARQADLLDLTGLARSSPSMPSVARSRPRPVSLGPH